jgi:hypothetical protein
LKNQHLGDPTCAEKRALRMGMFQSGKSALIVGEVKYTPVFARNARF